MSFGIIRMQKFKRSDVRGIENHNQRKTESKSNPDIDKEKTSENISLKSSDSYLKSIDKNINDLELKKAVRKDAVVMVGFVITSDSEFFKCLPSEQQEEFFKDCYSFISDRYGEKNIINAVVHKDEKTPHLHIDMTPISDGRLAAKNIFDRKELQQLQTDFYDKVGRGYKLERGENREDKRKHITTEELKLQTKQAELQQRAEELTAKEYQHVSEEDLTPRKKGLFGKAEPLKNVVSRINSRFIDPLFIKIKDLVKANEKLQQENKAQRKEILYLSQDKAKLQEELVPFQELFKGIPQEKKRDVFNFAGGIRADLLKQEREREEQKRKEQEQAKLLEQKQVTPAITPKVERPRKEVSRGGFSR